MSERASPLMGACYATQKNHVERSYASEGNPSLLEVDKVGTNRKWSSRRMGHLTIEQSFYQTLDLAQSARFHFETINCAFKDRVIVHAQQSRTTVVWSLGKFHHDKTNAKCSTLVWANPVFIGINFRFFVTPWFCKILQ